VSRDKRRNDEALSRLAPESVLYPGRLKFTATLTLAEIVNILDETEAGIGAQGLEARG
jgi:hypothetical protein